MSLETIVMNMVQDEIEQYADNLMNTMKSEVHKKSGALAYSVSKEKLGKYGWLVGVDSAKLISDPRNIGSLDYSYIYLTGHRSYTIVPKNAMALRWEQNGIVHFAKRVTIPAHAGDPSWLSRSIANTSI